jgi:hypothetical protein
MQHIQALFCFKGRDHGNRFGLISAAVLVALLIFSLVFSRIPALLVVLSVVLGVICVATTNRRVRDSGMGKHWMIYPPALFALCLMVMLSSTAASSYLVFILPLPIIAILLSKPSEQALTYVWGYHGPVDLSATVDEPNKGTQYANRIEPTFVAGQDEHYVTPEQAQVDSTAVNTQAESSTIDPLASFKALLTQHQKPVIIASGVLTVLVILAMSYPLWQSSNTAVTDDVAVVDEPKAVVAVGSTQRQHLLEMPTNDYFLLLDENKGLIIHWPSYDADNPVLWSVLTAQGELSCEVLKFNDKQNIRPNRVSVEAGGDYYASFSPLDTEALVSGIADKNSFSLCGYDFSLKGTRAAISGSAVYSQFLR